jgi:hypothetical protein
MDLPTIKRSPAFIADVKAKVEHRTIMIAMAGDFNLILTLDDKSSTIVEIPGCGC